MFSKSSNVLKYLFSRICVVLVEILLNVAELGLVLKLSFIIENQVQSTPHRLHMVNKLKDKTNTG